MQPFWLRITRTSGPVVLARGPVLAGSRAVARRQGAARAGPRPQRQHPALPAWPAARRGGPDPRRRAGPGPGPAAPAVRPGGPAPAGSPAAGCRLAGRFAGIGPGRPGKNLPVCGNVRFAFCAALPASLVPSRLSVPSDTMPSAASSRSTWLNNTAQRLLMPRPEPGDGDMIRAQPAGDHPVGHVPHAPLPGHPAGPLTLAVPIQQQRHHHLRVKRRPPVPIGPDRRRNPPRSRWPPRPAPRTPDRPRAATRAYPAASASADHAADKGKFCSINHDPRHQARPHGGAPFMRQAEICAAGEMIISGSVHPVRAGKRTGPGWSPGQEAMTLSPAALASWRFLAGCAAGPGSGTGGRQGEHPARHQNLRGQRKRDRDPLHHAGARPGYPGREDRQGHGADQRENLNRAAQNRPIRITAPAPRQHQRRREHRPGTRPR